jgi:hypothetical protein
MRTLILAALVCLIAVPADASNEELLKFFRRDIEIEVLFDEKVKHGCLPRPKAIEMVMELGLQRAGLRPATKSSVFVLYVRAAGYQLEYGKERTGPCIIILESEFILSLPFTIFGFDVLLDLDVPALAQTEVLSSEKSRMQSHVKETVTEVVDKFANEILKATEK